MRCIPCEERRQCGCGDTVTPEGVGVLIRNLARTGQFTGRKPVLTNKLKPVRAAAAAGGVRRGWLSNQYRVTGRVG
ncbi:MAG: hypothetical protein ACPIOQ_79190, partial [Promethearchaeia archaeon]